MKWDISVCFEYDDSIDETDRVERVKKLIDKIVVIPIKENEEGKILTSEDCKEEAHKFRTTHNKLTGKKINQS